LAARYAGGYSLWHDLDAGDAVNPLPYDPANGYEGGGPSRSPRVYRVAAGPTAVEAERINEQIWRAGGF
jgi:hypothetical protein